MDLCSICSRLLSINVCETQSLLSKILLLFQFTSLLNTKLYRIHINHATTIEKKRNNNERFLTFFNWMLRVDIIIQYIQIYTTLTK